MHNNQIFYGDLVKFFVTCLVNLSFITSQLLLSRTELRNCTRSILMENCDHFIFLGLSILFLYAPAYKAWIFEKFNFELEAFSYNFKINCMLVWQLMSLNKKMFASSGKLNIIFMVSYLYSFNPRVGINENCNPLAEPVYSNTESGNSRWFCPLRVQELDRRSFILILDWILV